MNERFQFRAWQWFRRMRYRVPAWFAPGSIEESAWIIDTEDLIDWLAGLKLPELDLTKKT